MNVTRSRLTLWILIAIFVLPSFLAIQFYYFRPASATKSVNRGTLLQPVLQFSDFFDSNPFGHRWLVLQVEPKTCEEQCQKNVYKINQVWLLIGGERERVERGLVTQPELKDEVFNPFVRERYPMVKLLLIPEKKVQLLRTYGDIFIVDPLGNIILAYTETALPDDIYSDLKRLLNVSRIG